MLQPIQVDFGRGIASAMGNATESVKNIGDIARNYLTTEERKKTRAEDVAYRDQQAATAKEQFDKSFGLQQAQDTRAQAQEGRTANEAKILSNTRQALPVANQEVQAMMQDVVTPRQSDAILAAYNKNPKADVQGMVNKAQVQYNANPVLQKQMLQSMVLSTGADESVDAQGDKIFTDREVDPTQMIAQRDKLLTGLDQQIAAGKLMDWEKIKHADDMGLKKQELGLRARALTQKSDTPITMYKLLPDGRQVTQKVTSESMLNELHKQGYQVGNVSGSYKPEGNHDKGGGTPVVPLRTGIGAWDDQRVSNMANVLQTAGLSGKDAVGLANMTADQTFYGTGVDFSKILEPVYAKLKAKDPTVTKEQVSQLLNTAF